MNITFKPPWEGVNRVEKDNDDGTWTLLCNKEEIECKIVRVNIENCLQADNIPLQMEPLCIHSGEDSNFQKWEEIASGELKLPEGIEVNKGVWLWFKKIQSTEYTEHETEWTSDEYCNSWKQMDEHTTSLPGPAFSHFKTKYLSRFKLFK